MKQIATQYGKMTVREGTLDEYIIGEQGGYARAPVTWSMAKVLDLGGNIGAFARMALSMGAAKVTSYEPEPENFSLMKKNTAGWPVEAHNMAVTANGGEMTLRLCGGQNKGSHSILGSDKREGVPIRSISFDAVIQRDWDIVKIDVEGTELTFDWKPLWFRHIPAFLIEYHATAFKGAREKAREIHDTILSAGFIVGNRHENHFFKNQSYHQVFCYLKAESCLL